MHKDEAPSDFLMLLVDMLWVVLALWVSLQSFPGWYRCLQSLHPKLAAGKPLSVMISDKSAWPVHCFGVLAPDQHAVGGTMYMLCI